MKFLVFCGAQNFVTVFKRDLYLTLPWGRYIHMTFEIIRALNINNSVFWNVTPCRWLLTIYKTRLGHIPEDCGLRWIQSALSNPFSLRSILMLFFLVRLGLTIMISPLGRDKWWEIDFIYYFLHIYTYYFVKYWRKHSPNIVNRKIISISFPWISIFLFSNQSECWDIAFTKDNRFLVSSIQFNMF
jgi:hypothetical protein